MALTDAEKNDVVRLLGWPGSSLISTSTNYNRILVGRLAATNSEIETDVRSLMDRIDKLDTRLDSALERASTKKIGDIEINPEEMTILRKERRRVIAELARLIDVPMVAGNGITVGVVA